MGRIRVAREPAAACDMTSACRTDGFVDAVEGPRFEL